MSTVVPDEVKLAAKRGFVRTTSQAYSTALAGVTVTTGSILALVDNPDPKLFVAAALAFTLSPLAAGVSSYLSITSKGIPEEYVAAGTSVKP